MVVSHGIIHGFFVLFVRQMIVISVGRGWRLNCILVVKIFLIWQDVWHQLLTEPSDEDVEKETAKNDSQTRSQGFSGWLNYDVTADQGKRVGDVVERSERLTMKMWSDQRT